MMEGIEGRGEIRRDGKALCRVRYQLQRQATADEPRFTLTDGVIEIEQAPDSDAVVDLSPGQELTLYLEKPLRDGRRELTVFVEPYEGHRPDERYQVTIEEDADREG